MEVEAKLVHSVPARPYRSSRSPTVGLEAHGSHCDGGRKQPRPHALEARRCHRRDSKSCRSRNGEEGKLGVLLLGAWERSQQRRSLPHSGLHGVFSIKVKGFLMTTRHKPSIDFVHGIWADGSSFRKLIPPLQAGGYRLGKLVCVYNLVGTAPDALASTSRLFVLHHSPQTAS